MPWPLAVGDTWDFYKRKLSQSSLIESVVLRVVVNGEDAFVFYNTFKLDVAEVMPDCD